MPFNEISSFLKIIFSLHFTDSISIISGLKKLSGDNLLSVSSGDYELLKEDVKNFFRSHNVFFIVFPRAALRNLRSRAGQKVLINKKKAFTYLPKRSCTTTKHQQFSSSRRIMRANESNNGK